MQHRRVATPVQQQQALFTTFDARLDRLDARCGLAIEIVEALKWAADNMIQDPRKRGWVILAREPNRIVVRRTLAELSLPFAMIRGLARSPLAGARWDGVAWYSPTTFFGPLIWWLKRRAGCPGDGRPTMSPDGLGKARRRCYSLAPRHGVIPDSSAGRAFDC